MAFRVWLLSGIMLSRFICAAAGISTSLFFWLRDLSFLQSVKALSPDHWLLLLLLLSCFSRVQLCVTQWMAAHQAPLSLGFSRQEHWSGLPFPSPMHESEKWKWSRSVMSDSLRPHGLQPTRLLHPWDFPGKSTGVGCHCLLRLTTGPPGNSQYFTPFFFDWIVYYSIVWIYHIYLDLIFPW